MREIKFRGLTVDGKGWVYGFYRKNTFYNLLGDEPLKVYTKHFIGCFDNKTRFDNIFEQVEVIPESVGQLTGLKDKNGVDIYEHDRLKADNYSLDITEENTVEFEHGTFTIGRYWKDGQHDWCSMEQYDSSELEVIGNIHESKEVSNG